MATCIIVISNPDVEAETLQEDAEVLMATERDFNTSSISVSTVNIFTVNPQA